MAIWYFECMDASACQSGSNTYLVGPHKGCENKPAGCMPAFYVFFIINFAQIVLAILKRWGVTCSSWSMLCAGQASNANVAMHAAAIAFRRAHLEPIHELLALILITDFWGEGQSYGSLRSSR